MNTTSDLRLIEHGFPCHQVGAQTRRERDGGNPPNMKLHVWWARRPLTPSRASVIASFLSANADIENFVRELGIEKHVVSIGQAEWVLPDKLIERAEKDTLGNLVLMVDEVVIRAFEKELERRAENRKLIDHLIAENPALRTDEVVQRWAGELTPLPKAPTIGALMPVSRTAADPDWANQRIAFETAHKIRTSEDKYGYSQAYARNPENLLSANTVVLDPTSGGGSIPFEALRLGARVIANELNPVASVILHATLDYPARFGTSLTEEIARWGARLRDRMVEQLEDLFPASKLQDPHPELDDNELLDGFLYTRTVTCPHCEGVAPLLNSCWLSKAAGDQWGVRPVALPDKTVRFETYRCTKGRGPNGEDPEPGTVARGTGQCLHCKQAIDGDEIKAQARG